MTIHVLWFFSRFVRGMLLTVANTLLVSIFIVWAVTCAAVGAALPRRAPAVSLGLFGSVLGAIGGFLVGNADGPAKEMSS